MKAGWQIVSLEEVCEFLDRRGVTPEKLGSQFFSDGFRVISAKNIKGRSIDIAAGEQRFVNEPTYKRWMTSSLLADDVILTSEAPLGEPAYLEQDLKWCLGQRLFGVRSNKSKLFGRFLFYAFQASPVRDDMLSRATGATAQGIRQSELRKVKLPLPPLPEQQRIVAILDEAFDSIAAARANAEQNRQNARALFESYLQSVFSQRGEGWVEMRLTDATGGIFTGPFGSLLHKSDYIENGIPLVNPAHITSVGIEPDFRKTVSEGTASRLSSYIMREGDIVIGRRGEMGRCAIITNVEDGWLCGTGSFFIKPSDRCDANYLVRLLRSGSYKAKLENIAGGAVMPNLSNIALGNLSILLPPIAQQRIVIKEIDDMATETQRLESLYLRKIAALDELKQSLLQQAFSCQL